MAADAPALTGSVRALLARLDAAFNRLYTWRFNPLYHSGALAIASFVVLLLTGLYLLLFYRIGAPYASVARITDQAWSGSWIRALHRYASDVAVVAAAVHALRMFLQGRTWGPRTLAWVSGLVLLFVFFVCGWTGYVMVWDTQAQLLAVEGARFLDVLPLFGEPIARTFVGERDLPAAFFFLNLFLHIALPIGVGLILWIHVARVARPALMPPRGLLWGSMGVLTALSILWPVGMAAEASAFRLPEGVPLDVFYGFWLPVTMRMPAWAVWIVSLAGGTVLVLVPWLTRPRSEALPLASVVNERFCTGCLQCAEDCPYDAISMIPRPDGRAGLVASVDPALCVSCGICAGSCAPMGVGPPGRTGRDQLEKVKRFIGSGRLVAGDVVVVGCDRSGGVLTQGAPIFPVQCAGSTHTSVIEYLVRSGASGVVVASCPPRDCWNREGVKWLEARVYHDREAELKPRVDKKRVRIAYAGEGEAGRIADAVASFRAELAELAREAAEEAIELDTQCETTRGRMPASESVS
jgi:coenzyme F420-reducing hydrogenase delta subunit/Pyruvate/2-oxoacid:ferredoxin oxidoreductase delta subunit